MNEIKGMLIWLSWGIGDRLPYLNPSLPKGPWVTFRNSVSRGKSLKKWITILHNLYALLFSKTDYQIPSEDIKESLDGP